MINQVLCLTIASVLLPPVSFDYTLLHLYAPFAMLTMLVLDARPRPEQGASPGRMMLTFALFAFLLSPQSELIFHRQRFGSQIKAIALIALFLIGLLYRFPSQLDGTPQPVPHDTLDRFYRRKSPASIDEDGRAAPRSLQ